MSNEDMVTMLATDLTELLADFGEYVQATAAAGDRPRETVEGEARSFAAARGWTR